VSSRPIRRQAPQRRCARLHDASAVLKLRLDQIPEIPLPGRRPVTLATGKDPFGLVPGLAEAVARRRAVLRTEVQSPGMARAFALERVRASPERVELLLLLFPTTTPTDGGDALARVRLRFGVKDGSFRGRVDSLMTPSKVQVQFDSEQTLESLLADVVPQPGDASPKAPASRPAALPPASSPTPSRHEGPLLLARQNARLAVWFCLFLAATGTWQLQETNRRADRQARFNKATRARAEARAVAFDSDIATDISLTAPPEIIGELNPLLLDAVMLRATEDLDDCYFDVVDGKTLPPEGQMGIQLELSASGQVGRVDITQDTLRSPALQDCVVEVLTGIQGPALRSGELALVTYTFDFRVL